MRMASAGEVFAASAEGNGRGGFVSQFARAWPENVNAQDAIRFGVGENLDKTFSLTKCSSTGIGSKRK